MSEITIEPQVPRSSPANAHRISTGRIAGFGLLAIALAVIANVIVLTIVVNVLGLPEFGAMNPVMVVSLTAVGVLLATIVFAIVSRIAQNPTRVFSTIAVIALVLSFVPNILTLTGTLNLNRGPGNGGRAGQQAGTPANGGAQANTGSTNTGANGQNTQSNAPQTGRFQRNGQGFGALRIPMQLSLMAMHVVAFIVTLIVLTRAAASSSSTIKPKTN